MLSMGPIVFEQMRALVNRAESDATDAARLRAYDALKQIVNWLAAGPGDQR
jgi:hypothetical protein